jgi:hypothetical protein
MDGMNARSAKIVGHDLFHPYSSHFFILPLDASSSEQMKKWRLIIQEAKAHPELYRREEGRKEVYLLSSIDIV